MAFRSAVLPVGCLVLFAVFLALSGIFASVATESMPGGWHQQAFDDDKEFWSITTVHEVSPGDLVRLEIQRLQPQGPEPADVLFYVVEGGQGSLLIEGGEASVIHAGTYPPWGFQFRRPAPTEGAPEAASDGVDIVFRYERPATLPEADFEAHINDLHSAVRSLEWTVADGRWMRWQPVLYTGAALSLLVGVISAAGWIGRGRGQTDDPASTPLEDLLTAQALTRQYLRGLLDAMRVMGALLVLVGLAGLAATFRLVEATLLSPGPLWDPFMEMGAVLAFLGGLAIWWVHYRRVAREMKRWDASPAPEV